MFDIPEPLSPVEKEDIESKFGELLEEVANSIKKYDSADVTEVCEIMAEVSPWLKNWVKVVELFQEMVEARGAFAGLDIPNSARNFAITAMVYLIEPFDVIYDYELRGYVDDAWALKLALTKLKSQYPDLHALVVEGLE